MLRPAGKEVASAADTGACSVPTVGFSLPVATRPLPFSLVTVAGGVLTAVPLALPSTMARRMLATPGSVTLRPMLSTVRSSAVAYFSLKTRITFLFAAFSSACAAVWICAT